MELLPVGRPTLVLIPFKPVMSAYKRLSPSVVLNVKTCFVIVVRLPYPRLKRTACKLGDAVFW